MSISSSSSSSSISSSSSYSFSSNSSSSTSSSSSTTPPPWFVVVGGGSVVVPGPGLVPGNSDFAITGMVDVDDTYIYKDFGPNYFNDSFIINFDANITAGDFDAWHGIALSNVPGTMSTIGASGSGLYIAFQGIPGPRNRMNTRDVSGLYLVGDSSTYLDIPYIQTYYYQIERNTDIPGNDRFFVRRYTNPARTSGLFQLQHNGVDPIGYRYLVIANIGTAFIGNHLDGFISNIDVISP